MLNGLLRPYTGLHYAYNIGRADANTRAVLLFTSAQNLKAKSMSTTASLKYQCSWSSINFVSNRGQQFRMNCQQRTYTHNLQCIGFGVCSSAAVPRQ